MIAAKLVNLATEGVGYRKFRVPMCLTQHSGALTEDQVIHRARLQ